MDFGGVGSSTGGRGADNDPDSQGGIQELKRKFKYLEASMKVMKYAFIVENADKSEKILQLTEQNVMLDLQVKNSSFQGLVRSRERHNSFAVFPVEIWEMIIGNMKRSSDLEMLCLAYPQLVSLVKKTHKTIFMFENILPFVSEHLDKRGIYNCRLVCQKWNQNLCTLLADLNSPNLLPLVSGNDDDVSMKPSISESKLSLQLKNAFTFNNPKVIQDFLTKMADRPGNPFVGRYISLCVDRSPNFWKSVSKLLEKFGKQIWNLEVELGWNVQNQVTFYKGLQETLLHVPNLKYLTVQGYFSGGGLTNSKMSELLMTFPLPPLPYLQSLKLLLGETAMITAFTPFFSQQIRRLDLLNGTMGNVYLKDETFRGFIYLNHLAVEPEPGGNISRVLKFPSPNLKMLCLHSNYYPIPGIPITSGQLGNLFEKFPRLQNLDLTNHRVVPSSSTRFARSLFSKLENLKFAVVFGEDGLIHEFDFILWFENLKHLTIVKKKSYETNQAAEMDQNCVLKLRNYLYSRQLLDSNIWTLIPSLKILEVKYSPNDVKKYTREMFEKCVGLDAERQAI